MNLLWLCNKAPKAIMDCIGEKANNMGGWLDNMSKQFIESETVSFTVLAPGNTEKEIINHKFSYYSFLENKCKNLFCKVLQQTRPDVIHIWGTEYQHTRIFLDVCEKLGFIDRCVLSIQGLVSIYGKYHYTEGLPSKIVKRFTLRDFLRQDNIDLARKKFIKRGQAEIEAIKKVKHIIGRTDWDKAIVEILNPKAEYHFCNESLRDAFYNKIWNINNIDRCSIFVSQCSYPVKGFHYLLEAMPFILQKHPNTHVYTTGKDLLCLNFKEKLLLSSYQKYLLYLIYKFKLEDHISFLGTLSEEEMCEQYLKANVFASPSTIENSSNSVGEAMLLGCPVISSDVGGIKNLLTHGIEGYIYQSTAPYMLAYYINKIFANDNIALSCSTNSIKKAKITHDRDLNISTLKNIYKYIIGGDKTFL